MRTIKPKTTATSQIQDIRQTPVWLSRTMTTIGLWPKAAYREPSTLSNQAGTTAGINPSDHVNGDISGRAD
jgi:hypothetical protein